MAASTIFEAITPYDQTALRPAIDVGQILDEANTCLYVAKRNNRYQIVRCDQVERCRFTQAIWTSPQVN